MRIDIFDAEPNKKTIEEQSGSYTRYLMLDNRKIVNNNVIDVEEAVVALVKDIWPDLNIGSKSGFIERELDDENKKNDVFSSAHCRTILIDSLEVTDNAIVRKELSEVEQEEIWLAIIFFLSGICSEPDSTDFPGLPLVKPDVIESHRYIILKHQRNFNKKKAKPTKSKTKVSRNVVARFRRSRLTIGGFWTDIVLGEAVRTQMPQFPAKVTNLIFEGKLQLIVNAHGNKGLKIDITEQQLKRLPLSDFGHSEIFLFFVDQIYTESNDSSTYELQSYSAANDDHY